MCITHELYSVLKLEKEKKIMHAPNGACMDYFRFHRNKY